MHGRGRQAEEEPRRRQEDQDSSMGLLAIFGTSVYGFLSWFGLVFPSSLGLEDLHSLIFALVKV
jgi:hypothetical protein